MIFFFTNRLCECFDSDFFVLLARKHRHEFVLHENYLSDTRTKKNEKEGDKNRDGERKRENI